MKNVLSYIVPAFFVAIVQTVVKSHGYMLGAIPTVVLVWAAFSLGKKLGNRWEKDRQSPGTIRQIPRDL